MYMYKACVTVLVHPPSLPPSLSFSHPLVFWCVELWLNTWLTGDDKGVKRRNKDRWIERKKEWEREREIISCSRMLRPVHRSGWWLSWIQRLPVALGTGTSSLQPQWQPNPCNRQSCYLCTKVSANTLQFFCLSLSLQWYFPTVQYIIKTNPNCLLY